jgi:diguanylate cyclase (GGDEF)-like protein
MADRGRVWAREARVWAFIAVLLGAAATVQATLLAGLPAVTEHAHLPWVALAAGFAVAELCVVHLTVGRDAVSFAFAEVPLVLGLFLATPSATISARVAGGAVALVWHRRQTITKLAFNLAQCWLSTVVAVVLWRLVVGGGEAYSLRGWLGALLAAMTIELLAALSITAVIALRSGTSAATWPVALSTGLLASSANACFALVALDVVRVDLRGLWTVGVLAAFLVLAHRAHLALLRRHDAMERLHEFTRRIGGGDLHLDVVVREVLTGVRELLEVALVRLDLHGSGPAEASSWICDEAGIRRCEPRSAAIVDAETALPRPGAHVPELTVPLHGDAGPVGALTVSGRLGDVGGLQQSDLRLLENLAGHAAIGLHNGLLADRLRDQVSENAHQAMHDSLTGLPNRLMFDRAATDVLARSSTCAVLLLDLDRFKEINDTLGHAAGDAVLQEVGARLRSVVPPGACVARLGGDEFAMVLVQADLSEARRCADLIRSTLARALDVMGMTLTVDASVGIAISPDHGDDIATLLRRADVAMYDAKDNHSGVAVYAADRDHHSAERLTLVADLRAAIANGELVLAYQPKVTPSGRAVHGVEALVRWKHPVRGMIAPDEFIGIAEQTGLIGPLTEWVLRTALAQCRRWLEAGLDLGVAVNISPRTLHDPTFSGLLAGLLTESRVPAGRLTLEITEGALMADPERAIDVLWELRRSGVRLSVDDLGVGHSSLSYLKRLPVHEIKIDRSFVTGMVDDGDDEAIVTAIIAMVHRLRMTVVAEGVEDERTLVRLAELGADVAQGYWMSRPIPAGDIAPWIDRFAAEHGSDVVVPMQRVVRAAH